MTVEKSVCMVCGDEFTGLRKREVLCDRCVSPQDVRVYCRKCKTVESISVEQLGQLAATIPRLSFPIRNGIAVRMEECPKCTALDDIKGKIAVFGIPVDEEESYAETVDLESEEQSRGDLCPCCGVAGRDRPPGWDACRFCLRRDGFQILCTRCGELRRATEFDIRLMVRTYRALGMTHIVSTSPSNSNRWLYEYFNSGTLPLECTPGTTLRANFCRACVEGFNDKPQLDSFRLPDEEVPEEARPHLAQDLIQRPPSEAILALSKEVVANLLPTFPLPGLPPLMEPAIRDALQPSVEPLARWAADAPDWAREIAWRNDLLGGEPTCMDVTVYTEALIRERLFKDVADVLLPELLHEVEVLPDGAICLRRRDLVRGVIFLRAEHLATAGERPYRAEFSLSCLPIAAFPPTELAAPSDRERFRWWLGMVKLRHPHLVRELAAVWNAVSGEDANPARLEIEIPPGCSVRRRQ